MFIALAVLGLVFGWSKAVIITLAVLSLIFGL